MLPQVASFKPEIRNKAIEKIKTFLIPATQTSTGGSLLPAVGIHLNQNRIKTNAVCLTCPELISAGVKVPPKSGENWAPILGKSDFRIDPTSATELNVVVFFHRDLKQGQSRVYNTVRDFVNGFKTHYRFGQNPYRIVETGDNEQHWGSVEKFFSEKVPPNLFVLDFTKPRGALDPAYPVIKHILTKGGFISQVIILCLF
jgi:hypothetical protein